MENAEPFECCPSIGRHVSYTHVPKQEQPLRTKSAKPIDKIAEKLARRIRPLQPYGEVLFKADDAQTKKRNLEAATVSQSSIKPYTRWLSEWAPGDPLPLIPPGFQFNLCDDMSGGRLVNRDRKKKPRIGPINDADIAIIEGFDQKSLGPKIKDSVYSLLSMVARSRGLWVDDKNKLRCPPGTPNANQFTDITGSNCFIPVAQKPTGAVSSGARLARRAAAGALVGAMSPGARDYPEGYNGRSFVGERENYERGRSMIVQSTTMAKDFKSGLFRLPSGQAITHFRQNAQGRTNFLLAVQELMPHVDQAQAAEFWDSMLGPDVPLTSLQKAQMEDYIESYFMSWFMEAKENPQKAAWVTHMRIAPPNSPNGWEINLRGVAGQKNKKGQTVYDPNMPISESGFEMSMTFNPVAAYYLAKGDGNDKRHTGHGSQFNMRSQGLYTGTHEFGHLAHFGQAMSNMGFNPQNLQRGKSGEWKVDLRNIQNPNNDPGIARIMAMVSRLENFQSGNRWETLPSGQRVRRYAKDVKEAVTELYAELYDTMTKNVGGTEEDFRLLQRMVGANYAHTNLIEARAEAYAVMRHFGPQGVANFAREHAAYQASNPNLFPNPESEYDIADNAYSAMDRIFGSQTRDWWHSRNNALGVNTLTGGTITPTGSTIPSGPPTRGTGLARFLPRGVGRSGGSAPGPGLSGPMAPRRITGRTPTPSGLSGAISSRNSSLFVERPRNADTMPIQIDGTKAIQRMDTDVVDLLAASGLVSDSVDISDIIPDDGVLIESPGVFEKLAEAADVGFIHSMNQTAYVGDTAMVRRASGKQITGRIDEELSHLSRPRGVQQLIDELNYAVERAEAKISSKNAHIAEIKALQAKLAKDRNDPDLADEIARLSYSGMTLDETLAKLESRKRHYKSRLDRYITDIDKLMSGDVAGYITERKLQAQNKVLAAVTAVKRITDRFPQLKGVLLSLDPRGTGQGNAAGYAAVTTVSGRIVPNFKLDLPRNYVEDVSDPNLGIPGNSVTGDFKKSTRLTVSSVVYHEMGHNLDAVSQLNGYGIKTGIDSEPVVDQIRQAGTDLGDSVVGTMYALSSGKSLSTKIDDLDDNEKAAITHFVGWGLGVNGNPRETMTDGAMVRAFALSAVQATESSTPGKEADLRRTQDYAAVMQVGTTRDLDQGSKTGGVARVVKGKEKDVTRVTTRISQILSEALGWDINQGVFGEARGVLDREGILAESSKYAKTLRTERLAEGFTVMMLMKDFAPGSTGPDTVRQQQAAAAMENLIANLPSNDRIVGLTSDQKTELAELQEELMGMVEIPVFGPVGSLYDSRNKPGQKANWKLANTFDFNEKITDDNLRQIGVRRQTSEKNVVFATESQINKATSNGLSGAMAKGGADIRRYSGFETDQGSRYSIDSGGRVTRFKPTTGSTIEDSPVTSTFDNTVFVNTEDLYSLKVSFDRGVGVSPDGKLVGLVYDDSSVNVSTFNNLRSRGEPFDRAFRLSGGVITEKEIVPEKEPAVGLHPFEWNNSGTKHHAGNAIVNVVRKESSGDGLTGAMSAAEDYPDVPNPRMPKEAREGNYAYFPRGVWREDVHFPMADIIRTQFNSADENETVAETYERIAAYWNISPNEVQRHLNEVARRPYYDEPFVLPPKMAGVKFPNRIRTEKPAAKKPANDGLTGAMSGAEKAKAKTDSVIEKAQSIGIDLDKAEKTGAKLSDTDIRIRRVNRGVPTLSQDAKDQIKRSFDSGKTDLEILRDSNFLLPGTDSTKGDNFENRLAVSREIASLEGDEDLVRQIDEFSAEMSAMSDDEFVNAYIEAAKRFKPTFDDRPHIYARNPGQIVESGSYRTVHQGQSTMGGTNNWDPDSVKNARKVTDAILMDFPGDDNEETVNMRPVSSMVVSTHFSDIRKQRMRDLYGEDIELMHDYAMGKEALEHATTGARVNKANNVGAYGQNMIILRPEVADRTIAVPGDSISDLGQEAKGGRLSKLKNNGGEAAAMFFNPNSVLFADRTGRHDVLASPVMSTPLRYNEGLTVGGVDNTDIQAIVSDAASLRKTPIGKKNFAGVTDSALLTSVIEAAKVRDEYKEKYGIDVVVDSFQIPLNEVEPFNPGMTQAWVRRQIDAGKWDDISPSDVIKDEKTTPYEAMLRFTKLRTQKTGRVSGYFDDPNMPDSESDQVKLFETIIDRELERIDNNMRNGLSGLSGAMSSSGSSSNRRLTPRQAALTSVEETQLGAEDRVSGLKKAIDELENTGNWLGGDYGVVLADNRDSFADNIDADGISPQNRTAEEIAASGSDTEKTLAKAREKLRKAEDEVTLQRHLAESKKKRIEQNVIDLEDIDDATFEELRKEQEELERLRVEDPKAFRDKLSTGRDGETLVIHAGAAELDGGVLDPDKTQGRGGFAGSPGDTQALNAMQIQKLKDDISNEQRFIDRANETIRKINNREKLVVADKMDVQLLNNLAKALRGSDKSIGKVNLEVGDEIDLSDLDRIVYPAVGGQPERVRTFDELMEFALNERLNGINSQIQSAQERINSFQPQLDKIMESPRSGFLSSYPLSAGSIDSKGYFSRYADRVIPRDASGWLKSRWSSKLRGTAWLVSGKDGVDIVSGLGPSDERQILGANRPKFGLSARRMDSARMDQVSLAIMARAVEMMKNGQEVDADEILGGKSRVKARINSMQASGMTVSEIAERLDMAESSIYSLIGG